MSWLGGGRSGAKSRVTAVEAARGYPTGHAYRAQAIALRIMTAALMLSLAANVASALAITQLVPSLRLVPLFLTTEPEQRTVVRIQPAVRNGTVLEELEHGWVRQFVIKAETALPDPHLMQPVVRPGSGWIATRSTNDVYISWRASNEQYIKGAIANHVTRSVVLDDPVRLPQPGRVYQVDFVSVETAADGHELARHRLRALLSVTYRTTEASLAAYRGGNLDNPIGFMVTSYVRTGRNEGK